MPRAQIGGIDLEYEVRGTGEPVVLVRGSHIADAFAPLLAEPVLTEPYQLILYHRGREQPAPSRAEREVKACIT